MLLQLSITFVTCEACSYAQATWAAADGVAPLIGQHGMLLQQLLLCPVLLSLAALLVCNVLQVDGVLHWGHGRIQSSNSGCLLQGMAGMVPKTRCLSKQVSQLRWHPA